jgi:DNA repair protein RecO (recombination protein O)
MARKLERKMERQRAFVLHSTPWRETSLVIDLITEHHGRIAVIAKGAKRATSSLRAATLLFQPLQVNVSGQNELKTLTAAQWQGGQSMPEGLGLFCAYYMNELLLKIVARDDPHPGLFAAYAAGLEQLAQSLTAMQYELTLRRFEWSLLKAAGYAANLARDHRDAPTVAGQRYRITPGSEPFYVGSIAGKTQFAVNEFDGAVLQSALEVLESNAGQVSAQALQSCKVLLRGMLSVPLDGRTLSTRQILMDLQKL